MRSKRSFDGVVLERLRLVPLLQALEALGLHVSRDSSFVPVRDPSTERWYVSVGAGVVELLVTGSKWFDARDGKGGGGAIDLAMHLFRLDFVNAVKRLTGAGL